MTLEFFYRRVFLNRPRFHAGAYAIAKLQARDGYGDDARLGFFGEVELTDCNDRIVIDFSASGPKAAANARFKARMLAKLFTDYADALDEAMKTHARERKRKPLRGRAGARVPRPAVNGRPLHLPGITYSIEEGTP